MKDMESKLFRLEQSYQSIQSTDTLGEITKLKCEYHTILSLERVGQNFIRHHTLFRDGALLRHHGGLESMVLYSHF